MNCPNCSKTGVAAILYGYQANIKLIERDLERKEMVLGGCLVDANNPKWECNDCRHRWGQRED